MPIRPLWQDRHIIPKELAGNPVIEELQDLDLFDNEAGSNRILLPGDSDLEVEMGVSPHSGKPLSSSQNGIGNFIGGLSNLNPKLQAQELFDFQDAVMVALGKGEGFPNVSDSRASAAVNTKNNKFLANLDKYRDCKGRRVRKSYTPLDEILPWLIFNGSL